MLWPKRRLSRQESLNHPSSALLPKSQPSQYGPIPHLQPTSPKFSTRTPFPLANTTNPQVSYGDSSSPMFLARLPKSNRRSSQVGMPSSTAKQTPQIQEATTSDLYTYNSLASFSFGSAQHQQPTSTRPIHPLASAPEDPNNVGEDGRLGPSDVTPRPSMVSYIRAPQQDGYTNAPSNRPKVPSGAQAQNANNNHWGGDRSRRPIMPPAQASSASASATSLSSVGGDYSRSGSRSSFASSSTPQTSAEQSSITDTDDDAPRTTSSNSRSATSVETRSAANTVVEFSSDEDFGDSEYDEYYDEDGVDIEIGSAQYEGSIATHNWDREFYAGVANSSTSIGSGFGHPGRRGSIPIAIPGTPSVDDPIFAPGRNREDSLATLRRPSRSLNDDFVKLGLTPRSAGVGHTSGLPLPVSVPGSESDWRVLEERSKTRESTHDTMKDSEHSTPLEPDPIITAPPAAMEEFDLDWDQMRRGITGMDASALADIVDNSSADTLPSATGANSRWFLSWTKEARRPSAATVSSYGGDTFGRAIRDWDGPSYQAQRKDWSFKKEKIDLPQPAARKASSGAILSPRGSMAGERVSLSLPMEHVADKDAIWKGMRPNTYEIWNNDRVGRFRVDRRAHKATGDNKAPQQRLSIHPIKYPNGDGIPPDGPPVTIHKHSKAIAFSISRHYRMPRLTPPRMSDTLGNASLPISKRGSSMILLAPRHVQEAYTSTNTTRKLESHGLLNDTVSGSQEAKDRDKRRQREREKQKQVNKEKNEKERSTKEGKGKGKEIQQGKDDSYIINAPSSSRSSPPPPASAPSMHIYSPNLSSSSSSSSINRERSVPERSISRNSSSHSRRRRRVRDPLDADEDDDDDDAPPTRTPHSEAFGTMDASLIEQLRQERFYTGDSDKGGLWNRLVGRSHHSVTASPAQLHAPFVPPWLALQPRNKQESQQVVIDTLNDSFKDVGLLPSNYPTSRHPVPTSQRQKKIASSHNNNDPFRQIPDDSLYMLLPLWPGDSDIRSEMLSTSFHRPVIDNHKRQYLLIYYKPSEEKPEKDVKKRSRASPTSSYDSSVKREERVSVLLTSFHITARLVPYQKLQGTGVRVPDEGLSITGPLEAAFAQMPPLVDVDESYYEYILGICHSRDSGIEFYPDGLVRMGLCEQSHVPLPVSEEDTFPEPELKLTPIGRAVLEMVWSGALALTSFGTNT
ncbi:hypothetical protein H0H92_007901 [Tricholoma furcatifolium]|nr:hypothetical protein H0H92_007901 [Tricholoma furcatifolium]